MTTMCGGPLIFFAGGNFHLQKDAEWLKFANFSREEEGHMVL